MFCELWPRRQGQKRSSLIRTSSRIPAKEMKKLLLWLSRKGSRFLPVMICSYILLALFREWREVRTPYLPHFLMHGWLSVLKIPSLVPKKLKGYPE